MSDDTMPVHRMAKPWSANAPDEASRVVARIEIRAHGILVSADSVLAFPWTLRMSCCAGRPNSDVLFDSKESDPAVIELELDKDGSPVHLEPAGWYVCFVPGLVKQWWQPFVNKNHKHVFAMRPAGPGQWTLFEPWWHRLLISTITSEQARKFLIWGARGDVLHVHEHIPGHGSQVRGWMTCAALCSFLLGRKYMVWTPHGLYRRLLREPGVCRVDVSRLVRLSTAELAEASAAVMACEECMPGAQKRRPGVSKPFCMNCGRDLAP